MEFTDTLLKIGNTYYDHNKCYLAIDYYNKALIIYEKEKGKVSIDYADTLHKIGEAYIKTDKYYRASVCFSKSKKIRKSLKWS